VQGWKVHWSRGRSDPASFRPQGLATLAAACALPTRAGFISLRQRSWDSPFRAFPSREVASAFPRRRTCIPFAVPVHTPTRDAPARDASVSRLCPSRKSLTRHGAINAKAGWRLSWAFPFQGSRQRPSRCFHRRPLTRFPCGSVRNRRRRPRVSKDHCPATAQIARSDQVGRPS
jgi:hypothetical protein